MVRVIPNRALVSGKMHNIRETEEQNIFLADLEILSSETVAGYADFASRYVGKRVEVRLSAKNKVAGDHIMKFIVTYEGDEHGGSFYAEQA